MKFSNLILIHLNTYLSLLFNLCLDSLDIYIYIYTHTHTHTHNFIQSLFTNIQETILLWYPNTLRVFTPKLETLRKSKHTLFHRAIVSLPVDVPIQLSQNYEKNYIKWSIWGFPSWCRTPALSKMIRWFVNPEKIKTHLSHKTIYSPFFLQNIDKKNGPPVQVIEGLWGKKRRIS